LLVLADSDLDGFTARPGLRLVAYGGPVPLPERADIGRRVVAEHGRLLEALQSRTTTGDEFTRAYRAVKPAPGPTAAVFREDG
jgi:hypothetical protein